MNRGYRVCSSGFWSTETFTSGEDGVDTKLTTAGIEVISLLRQLGVLEDSISIFILGMTSSAGGCLFKILFGS
jgi:hypothetical protein